MSTKHGETVLRILGGCLPLSANRSLLMAPVYNRSHPHWKLNLRVVVWVNKLYHLQHPFPLDVEFAYMNWRSLSVLRAERLMLDTDSTQRAFPQFLRSDDIYAQ